MGVITPFLMEKTLTLEPQSNYLQVDYSVTNIGTTSFPYIWEYIQHFLSAPIRAYMFQQKNVGM